MSNNSLWSTRPGNDNLTLFLTSYQTKSVIIFNLISGIDIFAIYLHVALISMMSPSPSGMRSMSSTDQRRAPRRPSLSNTGTGRPDYQGTKKAYLPSWGVSSVGCSFGDGQGNHGALTEANRASKEFVRKSSAGQGILGKVRHYSIMWGPVLGGDL